MAATRPEMVERLADDSLWHVIIVGAGINGISVFRELALQGLRVLLIDKGDFCGACSSAPSRLIHGGLRYLENGELKLVREALRERNALLTNAAHLVQPLPTTIPIAHMFSGLFNSASAFMGLASNPARRGALPIKIGLSLYDLFSRDQNSLPPHTLRGRGATKAAWPQLTREAMFSATYYDASISFPERLAIELIADGLSGSHHAAAINYCSLAGRRDGDLVVRDELSGREFRVRSKIIVNACGAWIDQVNESLLRPGKRIRKLVGGTKGSHLVIDHPELRAALNGSMMYFETADGRLCLAYPFLDRVLLGATDIRVDMPAEVRCEEGEVDYLLGAISELFPTIDVGRRHIVYRFSGVRPLKRSDAGTTGRITRDHAVVRLPGTPEILCLVGGKWTTFRSFGEDAADKALKFLGVARSVHTSSRAIGGGAGFKAGNDGHHALATELAREYSIDFSRALHISRHYGTGGHAVLSFARAFPDDTRLGESQYTEAEIRWIIRHEYVCRLADLLQRRTSLAITGAVNARTIARAAEILAEELGWSGDRMRDEAAAFRQALSDFHGVTEEMIEERAAGGDRLSSAAGSRDS